MCPYYEYILQRSVLYLTTIHKTGATEINLKNLEDQNGVVI